MPKVGMQPIRRQQLIEATLRVIQDVGLADASVKLITKRATLSNGIISHYFHDKDDLILSTARHLFAQVRARIIIAQQSTTSANPLELIDAVISALFCKEAFENNGGALWLGLYAKSFHNKPLERLIALNRRRFKNYITRQCRGCFSGNPPNDSVAHFVSLIEGLLFQAAINPDEHTTDFVKSIALGYLINFPAHDREAP